MMKYHLIIINFIITMKFDDDKEYSQTNLDGLSDYMLLTTLKVDNSGLNINFNNYYIGYYHNEILLKSN